MRHNHHRRWGKNGFLGLLAVALAALPLLTLRTAEFQGSDDQGKEMVHQLDPNYRPWFSPLWEPPGSEIESLLFSLQAALGAGVVGYSIGYLHARRRDRHESG
ncbi:MULTISPECIES: energy-coupling factor ABC transporter substrate-binding protein [Kyrpidia]|uniref:Cobalt transport protein CbiN n=2 Tax=Kyrpidia spormannii TaxID=2055160 RepID=A0ACA8Z708_9BACL|nr:MULTISPECIES: energy-coupling factor ABC transporter substrate-binding protein [Kyrpidia]MCL6576092.1 energy-coupling factor ABC transporter substrate-binding protein [Kyrpidia sp.]CAB3390628.1 Cobalt transport protein CbiN [Kyrpidia spormannii]CAB3391541.1 Cobalt transport protein CbiN [Kyrpidia spormannii]HHY67647.1 energy-coupling factor ABC transporter substrate-binding protein [Alicyclobacillus sp.]